MISTRFSALLILVVSLSRFALAQDIASLPPGAPLLPLSALPAYEKEIDHAGLIRAWDEKSLERGKRIYGSICQNCHGDLNLPGSIAQALRFGEGKFQHGKDPYTMYQTLTRGWRLMIPQVQLVPEQKYDVIHYIRSVYLKESNPSQWTKVTDEYLAGLPKGSSKGPVPVIREPWKDQDYGDFQIYTYQMMAPDTLPAPVMTKEQRIASRSGQPEPDLLSPNANIAFKTIAIRLDAGPGGVGAGRAWVGFEHDTLRLAGAWTGEGFIDWNGISYNGKHRMHPKTMGELQFDLPDGPGWANPATGEFDDLRIEGLDGRRFGPLPRSWGHYRGLYYHGSRIVISYSVGDASILESYRLEKDETEVPVFVRVLNIGKSSKDLILRAAEKGRGVVLSTKAKAKIADDGAYRTVRIAAADTPLNLELYLAKEDSKGLNKIAGKATVAEDLKPLTQGGPAHWPEELSALVAHSSEEGAFAFDRLTRPVVNPWKSRIRTSGLDFMPGGNEAVLCCWDGDVWKVSGLNGKSDIVTWKRIASGLFQPLGLKIINEEIYVICRDQIVRLNDLNGDGETDFYESFNSDHQVTEHFHEFAMGLQSDDEGNLYYAKSARHAKAPLVPHHGTLIKVSADGSKSEIIANGFRAANGVCRNPDGTFIVTDQEGHWNPMNRINWVKKGGFYGNMYSYGASEDSSDSAMEQPLCWVDKPFDRSPSELLWIESKSWGVFDGKLLNLSYGHGRFEIVPHEFLENGQPQGGLCRLPIPDLPTGIMRGRFNPDDGQLYVCGMAAWGTQQLDQGGGFYRIRYTGKPAYLPLELKAKKGAMVIEFSDALDPSTAKASNFAVKVWDLKRSAKYGSDHYNERVIKVAAVELGKDRKTITLAIPDLPETWGMEIKCQLKGANGQQVERVIQNTIHDLVRP
ncbi:MAG: hypothetical protein GXP30_07190 [Verrucomicrobia bacterium]|nr:hypothetical protein [Verrucomicrobiota bacterium]